MPLLTRAATINQCNQSRRQSAILNDEGGSDEMMRWLIVNRREQWLREEKKGLKTLTQNLGFFSENMN